MFAKPIDLNLQLRAESVSEGNFLRSTKGRLNLGERGGLLAFRMFLQAGGTPALIESPFTNVNAQGPLGEFPPTAVKLLVGVLTQIRERAEA